MTEQLASQLGLPPDASPEEVQRYLNDLKSRALGNLAGPDGWRGTAEGHRSVVFERIVEGTLEDAYAAVDLDVFSDHGTVEYVSASQENGNVRFSVRVAKETE